MGLKWGRTGRGGERPSDRRIKRRLCTKSAQRRKAVSYTHLDVYKRQGYDDVDAELPMTISGTTCTVDLPTGKAGDMYYYLEIRAGGKTVTKPYDKSAPIQVFVDDGSILGDPSQITMTPDTTQGNLRLSWITVPEVKASVVQYKKQGESTWKMCIRDRWQTRSGSPYGRR